MAIVTFPDGDSKGKDDIELVLSQDPIKVAIMAVAMGEVLPCSPVPLMFLKIQCYSVNHLPQNVLKTS